MSQRAFNNPGAVEVNGRMMPAYSTSDRLTMDFADLMNSYFGSSKEEDGVQKFKDALKVFDTYWKVEFPEPINIPEFCHEVEKLMEEDQDLTLTDISILWNIAQKQ